MREITLEELLEAGCHFGHQVTRHNPKSRDFVFEARDNIHIIDLAKTKEGLEAAGEFVRNLSAKGGTLIVLGAKRQARGIVEEEIRRAQDAGAEGIFSVTNRWIGGTLTNLPEVSKNYKKLRDVSYRLQSDEEKAKYTKKEVGQWEKERQKLEVFYGGVSDMKSIPDALFIIDTHLENMAVREAHAMKVKTVGIVDTNADPTVIDYPIPANDDAIGSLKLIMSYIVDAWIEGKQIQISNLKSQNVETEKKVEEVEKVEKEKNPKATKKKKEEKSAEEKPRPKADRPVGEKRGRKKKE